MELMFKCPIARIFSICSNLFENFKKKTIFAITFSGFNSLRDIFICRFCQILIRTTTWIANVF